ncbi:bacteriocin immunity protein [Lonsdalea quercina]|uniref:bacteriocin immunity protein n=1 Tax=Lonsdalea quercina TaxID=71657 RepID=UPI003975C6DB
MTTIYQNLNDYTQDDSLQFVKDIVGANSSTKDEHYAWVRHFELRDPDFTPPMHTTPHHDVAVKRA